MILKHKSVTTPFGDKFVIEMSNGKSVFVSNLTPRCLSKHGLQVTTIRRPVWVKLDANEFGAVWTHRYPSDINYVTGESYSVKN